MKRALSLLPIPTEARQLLVSRGYTTIMAVVKGTLVKRYKRFMADVTLDDGETVTAHCANPGSMMGLVEPGTPVWLSRSLP